MSKYTALPNEGRDLSAEKRAQKAGHWDEQIDGAAGTRYVRYGKTQPK